MVWPSLFLAIASVAVGQPHRWFPQFPPAHRLLVVPFAGDPREGMVLEALAGLLAREALHGTGRTLLWEETGNDGYQRWFEGYCADHGPSLEHLTLDQAVLRVGEMGLLRGYVLYRYDQGPRPLHAAGPVDESANVATTVAGIVDGVPVCEELEPRFQALGLRCLMDVRGTTELECLQQYGDRLSRSALGMADPKTRNARSLMIALGTACVSGIGEAYGTALARCEPDSPVIGWGCGTEDGLTSASTRAGLFQTATNWCHNLTVLAEAGGFGLVTPMQPRTLPPRPTADPVHWANFTLSDGDNIQWLMGNFMGGSQAPSYWGSSERGKIPFTWGIPGPGLAQLSPRTLAELLTSATPNDDFMLYSGGGYFYPDLYGADRPQAGALELHAQRLRGYCDLIGIRILAFNFMDWDSPAARRACETFARAIPGLEGIFAFQYYPYSAGKGRVLWVEGADGHRVPIVSCRLTIWAHTGRPDDTTPAGVAQRLNALPLEGRDAFSWVLVHAWSYFRQAESAQLASEEEGVAQDGSTSGSQRGYLPALWAAERLQPHVRLCGASELLYRLREAHQAP